MCGLEMRGRFRQNVFQALAPAELELLEEYALADFSIKELAKRTGLGYVALRSRLDRLIEHIRRQKRSEDEKKGILERVETGEISAVEAAEMIKKVSGGV